MNTTSITSSNFSVSRRNNPKNKTSVSANIALTYPIPYGRAIQNMIACSSLGNCVAFCSSGNIFNSGDFGKTFKTTTFPTGMWCIAMSSTGLYQVAGSTGDPTCSIYVSTNSGATWVTGIAIGANTGRFIECVAIDNTGQYMFAGGGGSAGLRNYVSIDFGATFKQVNPLIYRQGCCFNNVNKKALYLDYYNNKLCHVATTATPLAETIMIATAITLPFSVTNDSTGNFVAYNSRNTANIAFSSDAGVTFVVRTSPWFIHIMYTGSTLWGNTNTAIYKSTDHGLNWTIVLSPLPTIKSFVVNLDMTRIFFVHSNGDIKVYTI